MSWLTTYNDWSSKAWNQFGEWVLDRCLEFDGMFRNYMPAIATTLVIAFVAFVGFLFAVGAVKT